MASRPQSSTSRIMTIFILGVIGTIAWFIAPLFLPMYRWLQVDYAKIAQTAQANGYQVTAEQVATKYTIEFIYLPRHPSDPRPFVLLKMDPPYYDVVPDDDWSVDDDGVLVRCTIINDRQGQPPSDFMLGAGHFKDHFFVAKGWRFPPKSLGLNTGDRPVIVYDSMSLDKMEYGAAQQIHSNLNNPTIYVHDDDDWFIPAGD